jgi:hypothetical protein
MDTGILFVRVHTEHYSIVWRITLVKLQVLAGKCVPCLLSSVTRHADC